MGQTYIDDGYTREDGYITAAQPAKSGERLYDALSFSYRVATRKEVIRHDAAVRNALRDEDSDPECAVKAERLACEFVASRVKTWSLKNRGHHAVDVTADACERLNAAVFGKLYRIVRGSDVSDPKPTETESPPSDEDLAKN